MSPIWIIFAKLLQDKYGLEDLQVSIYTMDVAGLNASRLNFLRIELETGNTFISIAQSAGEDRQKADRNRANGRKAYDTILKFLPGLTMTPSQRAEFDEKLAAMKGALIALGEVFA